MWYSLSIQRCTEKFASKEFKRQNRLKPYKSFWRNTEYAKVYIKHMDTQPILQISDFIILRFQQDFGEAIQDFKGVVDPLVAKHYY